MSVPLYCDLCGTRVAEIEDGEIVIRARHHGEKHVTRVAVEKIVKMCYEEKGVEDGQGSITESGEKALAGY